MANKQFEKWAKNYYGQLVGYTITSFQLEDDSEIDEGFDYQFPTFTLSKGLTEPRIKISVSQDEEGNGGGFLFIEENK
jgi:hypothetical protein